MLTPECMVINSLKMKLQQKYWHLLASAFVFAYSINSPLSSTSKRPSHIGQPTPGSCGSGWQVEYARLHRGILAGRAPQRYLVVVAPYSGLADKLVGLPSQLLWAMLSRRALITLPPHDFPEWGDVFDMPNINMSAPSSFHISYPDWQQMCESSPPSNKSMHALCWLNAGKRKGKMSNLCNIPSGSNDTRALYVEYNRGVSYILFRNKFHNETLRSWGLAPETAFGCAMQFLFRLKEHTCGVICRRIRDAIDAASRAGVVVIGVQVRVGDGVMNNPTDSGTLEAAAGHFQCAKDIASDLKARGQTKSLVYLISDSLALIRAAQAQYGDWILADNETKPVHVGTCGRGGACIAPDKKLQIVQHTAHQAFLFSRAHYHVVSRMSGFGMIGAWMNIDRPIEHRVYRVNSTSARCKYGAYREVITNPFELYVGWSGI